VLWDKNFSIDLYKLQGCTLLTPSHLPLVSAVLKYRHRGDILKATRSRVLQGIWLRKVKKYGVYETLTDVLEVFEHSSRASAKVGNIEDYI